MTFSQFVNSKTLYLNKNLSLGPSLLAASSLLFPLQEFAVPNCIEGATYDPWKSLGETTTSHNYREGNLPPNSR